MSHVIVAGAERYYESLYRTLDFVAREKKYLAVTEAPPWENALVFYRSLLDGDHPQYLLIGDGDKVLGWCDIAPVFGQSRKHIGVLGVGLLPEARHQGWGAPLMQAAIDKAWANGLTRIELTVRADNLNAKALYEKLGFVHEGLRRRAMRVDGAYFDSNAMALLR